MFAADWNNESAGACFFSSLCAYAGEVKSGGLGDVGWDGKAWEASPAGYTMLLCIAVNRHHHTFVLHRENPFAKSFRFQKQKATRELPRSCAYYVYYV